MQNAHLVSHHMHHIHTDTTTRIVSLSPRHVAIYHLKYFAKLSIATAATITMLLYVAVLMVGIPAINL
ncbi:MAG: hypothetical protein ACO3F2_04605 [Roseiflexaceae bacterium]